MKELNNFYDEYRHKINILTLYIEEAHATDEWPIGSRIVINQHKTIEDRKNAALKMVKETGYKIPIVLDNMENQVQNAFKCWPFRFIIIRKGIVDFVAKPRFNNFFISDLVSELQL